MTRPDTADTSRPDTPGITFDVVGATITACNPPEAMRQLNARNQLNAASAHVSSAAFGEILTSVMLSIHLTGERETFRHMGAIAEVDASEGALIGLVELPDFARHVYTDAGSNPSYYMLLIGHGGQVDASKLLRVIDPDCTIGWTRLFAEAVIRLMPFTR